MNRSPRAWVLNLDAEHELEAHKSYAPTLHLRAIVERESRALIGTLVGPGDVVLAERGTAGDAQTERSAHGLVGLAWSPTPRSLARLIADGARPVVAPPLDVLRTVNARPFAVSVREPFARGSFEKQCASDVDTVLAIVARPARDGWLVRRTFGAAGRGRRRFAAGKPSAHERAWIEAGLRLGPLVVEPWVRVTREYTRSGWVRRGGGVVISPPCVQETTVHGAWTRTDLAASGDVVGEDDARLEAMFEAAGSALARAGYFGPFGIDAYRHRAHDSDVEVLNPLSEINARFTMDWATAMAGSAAGNSAERLELLSAQLDVPIARASAVRGETADRLR